jgi:hypothetical protein
MKDMKTRVNNRRFVKGWRSREEPQAPTLSRDLLCALSAPKNYFSWSTSNTWRTVIDKRSSLHQHAKTPCV